MQLIESRFVTPLERHQLPRKHRRWTGNDDSARNHNGRIPPEERVVYLELHWKRGKGGTPRFVGAYQLDLGGLLRENLVKEDPAGGYRLKFLHDRDGTVYLGRGFTKTRVPVGRA